MISGYDYLNSKRFDCRRKVDSKWICRNDVSWQWIPDVWSRNRKGSAANCWHDTNKMRNGEMTWTHCVRRSTAPMSNGHVACQVFITHWLTDWLTDWMVSLLDVSREDFSPTRIFPDICLTNWFENGLQKFESVTDHSEDYCRNYARN